jgi:hypothetical protein
MWGCFLKEVVHKMKNKILWFFSCLCLVSFFSCSLFDTSGARNFGTWSGANNGSTAICPIGTYSTTGSAPCTTCPTGYTTTSTGNTSCTITTASTSSDDDLLLLMGVI